jgi:hypothetical protein
VAPGSTDGQHITRERNMLVNDRYHALRLAGKLGPHIAEIRKLGPDHAITRRITLATVYVARTATWEGPARPEWAAAHADLLDQVLS